MSPRPARYNGAKLNKGEFSKNITKLAAYMRRYLVPIAVSLIFTVAATVISIYAPQVLSDLVDVITGGITMTGVNIDMTELARFAIILIVFYVCNALCTYVSSFIMTTMSQTMCRGLRSEISNKINKVPLKYFDSHPYGDTLSRVTNDVDTIGNSIEQKKKKEKAQFL